MYICLSRSIGHVHCSPLQSGAVSYTPRARARAESRAQSCVSVVVVSCSNCIGGEEVIRGREVVTREEDAAVAAVVSSTTRRSDSQRIVDKE